ncbi:MAG: hypothetical protein DKM50_08490 [Candidatus Margulisiibacteriota bacterium]|nr:MAG: hypothetical protein A2X43_11955 [Candidatus Margulisbacteria bacterium GWD2_39_127]OGI01853.1 MAG: hypothetical protein A2X42_04480 [Candidatus Margulisbacteria bacterium GWF2_38_17]OGI10175.1 MAG: hypothetical protein A2X41_01200 [Candidatus Margulisbacteria bacterium GWE2_39_32]PZM79488.1 MAG: hypothetical protein DKM50_08490 [Candidatus Margulisiibacteriota bacterium]HAR63841.1 hypothetical protein [Candidatus Margulisiibacteriota bacterium]
MHRYRKKIMLFMKIFFITLIIYHFIMYLWSNYEDSIKPLELAVYARIFWGDLKNFSIAFIFSNIMLPLMIALVVFQRIIIKRAYDDIKKRSIKKKVVKLIFFIGGLVFIYLSGPIVFCLIGIPIIILAAMFSIGLFLKHLSNKVGMKNG